MYHTGIVTWVPEVNIVTKCFIKIKDFPFDTQCCEINLYSWSHSAEQMMLLQYENKNVTNLTHLAHNSEWFIYNTCAINKTIECGEKQIFWITRYAIQIKRESIFYFYFVLMPCGVLSLCSILLFWIPADSEEKITLGITILLALFVNSLIVSNYTPEASFELPLIGKYYLCNIFIVSLSLAGTVFILRLHFRGYKTNRVPERIRKIFKIDKLNGFDSKKLKAKSEINLNSSIFKLNSIESNDKLNKEQDLNKKKSLTHKIFDLTKYDMKKSKEMKNQKKKLDLILVEWRELGRKIELIFFIINLLAVLILPTVLFIKYWFQDLSADHSLQENCSCDSIFS